MIDRKKISVKRVLLAAALLACGAAAHADDNSCEPWCAPFWKSMPAEEYVYFVAASADMLTTLDIKHHPNLYETNVLLGEHPSDAKVIGFFVAGDLLHAAVTYGLVDNDAPKPLVKAWEYITIGVETGYAAHNLSLGLRFSF